MKYKLSPFRVATLTINYESEESLQGVYERICKLIDHEEELHDNGMDVLQKDYVDLDGMVLEFIVPGNLEGEFLDLVPCEIVDEKKYYITFRSFSVNCPAENDEYRCKILQKYIDHI